METTKQNNKEITANVPVLNIRMMTDEEWNRLAYQQYLKRNNK